MSCILNLKEIVKTVKVIDWVTLELTLPQAILVMNLLGNTGSTHSNTLFEAMEKAGVPDVDVVKHAIVEDGLVNIIIDHDKLEEACNE